MMGYQATNGDAGGIGKSVNGLGKAIGVIVSIMATPMVFTAVKAPLYHHLFKVWGDGFAGILMWAMAAAIAYALYKITELIFTAVVIWAMASYAANRFGG